MIVQSHCPVAGLYVRRAHYYCPGGGSIEMIVQSHCPVAGLYVRCVQARGRPEAAPITCGAGGAGAGLSEPRWVSAMPKTVAARIVTRPQIATRGEGRRDAGAACFAQSLLSQPIRLTSGSGGREHEGSAWNRASRFHATGIASAADPHASGSQGMGPDRLIAFARVVGPCGVPLKGRVRSSGADGPRTRRTNPIAHRGPSLSAHPPRSRQATFPNTRARKRFVR